MASDGGANGAWCWWLTTLEETGMDQPFAIAWNVAENRLEFTLRGMWDDATVAEWEKVYRAAVHQAPRPGWTVLGDMTEHPPQSPKVQGVHEALMAFSAVQGMRAFALVVPKTVVAMQLRRLAGKSEAGRIANWVATRDEGLQALRKVISSASEDAA